MNNVHFKQEDNCYNIFLADHIDSGNATAVEEIINQELAGKAISSIIVNCQELVYISSAGLRILLRLKKKFSDMKIIEVSSEVYDIFDMTGFTEMIEIQKAFRVLSVDGCEVIGQGANGQVFRIDPETIVKVYRNPDSLPDIQRERELARKAFVLGVPTAIPYDVVRVGNSYGSVFELLNAKSLAKLLTNGEMSLDDVVKMSVSLLKKIHGTFLKPGDTPEMREVALDWVQFLKPHLPADAYDKLYNLFQAVPKDNHMLHGDYHIKNVMLQDGEALLIDMDTLCMGDPVYEFGSIFNAYVGFAELDPEEALHFLGMPIEDMKALWNKTLEYYFEGMAKETIKKNENRAILVGYTRLMRRSIRRNADPTIVEKCKSRIISLLDNVDSLPLEF